MLIRYLNNKMYVKYVYEENCLNININIMIFVRPFYFRILCNPPFYAIKLLCIGMYILYISRIYYNKIPKVTKGQKE